MWSWPRIAKPIQNYCGHPSSGKWFEVHDMLIVTIEAIAQVMLEPVYGRADGMVNSLESMVVSG